MEFRYNAADRQLRWRRQLAWRRPVLIGLRVLMGIALLLLMLSVARWPFEGAAVAGERIEVRHQEIDALGVAMRDLLASETTFLAALSDDAAKAEFERNAARARASLRTLHATDCGTADRDNRELRALGWMTRAIDSAERLESVPVTGVAWQLGELGEAARACLRIQLAEHAERAAQVRWQVFALVGLVAATIVAAMLVRLTYREQLRDQLRFNEQLIDAIPLPLSLRSPEGHFLRVNKAFEQRYGLAREQVGGRPIADFFPAALAAEIGKMDVRAFATEAPVEQEFNNSTPEQRRHVLVRVKALRQADDSVSGIVSVQTDITAMRQKEDDLRSSNEKLKQLSVQMIDAQEAERRRIARDLHDQVGQILTALKLQLASVAKREWLDKPAHAMAIPIDLADEALRSTRDLSASLHPHLLDDLGLEPALNWLANRFIRPSVPMLVLRFRLEPPRGPEAIEMVAFRAVQEALTNVVRHAHATRVGVILETVQGWLAIEVIDDGVGFEHDGNAGLSLGVTGMRDRVTECGGEMQLESKPGTGTSLRIRLPWRKEEELSDETGTAGG